MMMEMVRNQNLKEQIKELSVKVRHVGLIAQERPGESFRLESDSTYFYTVFSESKGHVLS